jgi:hypothetical protein
VHPAIAVAVLLAAGAGAPTVSVWWEWISRTLQLIQPASQGFVPDIVLVGAGSLAVQITTMWLLSRSLGIEIGFAALALGTSGGVLAQVIPISLAGTGPAQLGSGLPFAAYRTTRAATTAANS